MGFPPALEQKCHASRRVDHGMCGFPSRLSPEALPGGFPTGLSHVPPWWESILGMKVEAVEQNSFLWNGVRHLRDSWNVDTTLELLSPFLWRAPPLQMRRERWECFPDQAGKGSLISSYEAETGLLWMWAGPSFFL